MKPRRPIPRGSKAKAEADKVYRKVKRVWLKTLGEYPQCSIPGCRRAPDKTPHHILPRSVRKDLEAVAENFLAVCRIHHDEIHRRPAWAFINGYMGRSWDGLKELAERRKGQHDA